MKKLMTMRLLLLLMLPILFIACDEDPVEDPIVLEPAEDGVYIYGSNTIAATIEDATARMAAAVLDPGQGAMVDNMDGVYGKFMYIGANSTLNIRVVEGDADTTYGLPDGGTYDSASVFGNILVKDKVTAGTLIANEDAIEVAQEGLYYAFLNTNTNLFVLMKVKAQMIGDATELNWAAGTNISMKSSSKDSTVFEITGLNLKGATGYRYRFNDGWHVYADGNIITLSSLGVESYGTAWDTGINDLGYFLENTPHKDNGVFTVKLSFNAATGEWKELKTKTGELLIDYTDTQMGLFGNAYELASGDTANWGSGTDGYELHAPSKSGSVYTWTWDNVNLIEGREFIFLENGAWGGLQIDYLGAAVGGSATTNEDVVNATSVGGEFNNFFVSTGGSYTITLEINAETTGRTVTITSN